MYNPEAVTDPVASVVDQVTESDRSLTGIEPASYPQAENCEVVNSSTIMLFGVTSMETTGAGVTVITTSSTTPIDPSEAPNGVRCSC